MAGLPVAVLVSPKFQLNRYGVVPPLTVAVKMTVWLVCGWDGLKPKLAARVAGDTVMAAKVVALTMLASFAVTLIV